MANGQGLCERCNQAKESAAWLAGLAPARDDRHRIVVTTPTGQTYWSDPPDPPAGGIIGQVELYLSELVLEAG